MGLTEMHGVKSCRKVGFHLKRYIQVQMCKTCCASPVAKNPRVRASLSAAEIYFLKRVSFFEMNWATIDRRCSNRSGDI